MRIAFLWAVGQNTGNLAFSYAVSKHIVGDVQFLPWNTNPKALKKKADVIVMLCANQLGAHTDLGTLADNLKGADLPVVAIGLGAQAKSTEKDISLSEGTKRWVQTTSNLAISSNPNLYVRGSYTQAQLEKLGFSCSVVGGCPSHFINESENLGTKIAQNWTNIPQRVCVAAGHYAWGYTVPIEQQLVSLIEDRFYPGAYVTQSPEEMLKVSRGDFNGLEESTLTKINQYITPHLNVDEFKTWCQTYARSFDDVLGWMDFLAQQDITIGHRYHGVALALQAEKMGITIAIDSRTSELCSETGVPYIHYTEIDRPITRKNLFEKLISFDAEKYDRFRQEKVKNYIKFLESNQLQPAEYLYKIAGS